MNTKICIGYERRKDELMELPVGEYKVVIDLKGDNVLITNARMKKHWYKLCDISVEKDTKKAREDAARIIKYWYNKEKKICKSTVINTYSKEIADNAPVWQYVDNPYYKCSPSMQIYLERSIKYLYGNSSKA